jgi:hypothetical protein
VKDSELDNLLAQEYLHLQGVIEGFDAKALTIKAWSVTFSLAALGAAYAAKAPAIFAVASFSALLFWLLEGYWKTFQYAYYQRNGELEKHFEGTATLSSPMQIGSVWYKKWKAGGNKRLFRIMLWPHVALPHVAVIIVGGVLLALHLSGLVTVS